MSKTNQNAVSWIETWYVEIIKANFPKMDSQTAFNILDFLKALGHEGYDVNLTILLKMIKNGEIPFGDFEKFKYNPLALMKAYGYLFQSITSAKRYQIGYGGKLKKQITDTLQEPCYSPFYFAAKIPPKPPHYIRQSSAPTNTQKQRKITRQPEAPRKLTKPQTKQIPPPAFLSPHTFLTIPSVWRIIIHGQEIVKKINKVEKYVKLTNEERAFLLFYLNFLNANIAFQIISYPFQAAKIIGEQFSFNNPIDPREKTTLNTITNNLIGLKPEIKKSFCSVQ